MYIRERVGKSSFESIIFYATQTGNTKDIVKHMAEVLESDISDINKIAYPEIEKFNLVGFASGIYDGEIDKRLREVMEKMEFRDDQYVFIALTHSKSLSDRYVKQLGKIFTDKGVNYIGCVDVLAADRKGNAGFLGRAASSHPIDSDYYKVENYAVDAMWLVNRMLGNTEFENEITAVSERRMKLPIDMTGIMPKFMKNIHIDP
ncbi:MAG: hypothetical protein IIY83_06755 [Lachnospiraceae bacterium]|nr:hypothetical protein [Lachnospiraceae bacterium]